MTDDLYLGCDFGSRAVKLVIINGRDEILDSVYERNTGIYESVISAAGKIGHPAIAGVGLTGSGRYFGEALMGADLIMTEIVAHARASVAVNPSVSTVFDIGGEDCKLILIRNGMVDRFFMNALCGSGTGSMIETIAERLGVTVDEFGGLALSSGGTVNISGKCGIFSQSSVVNKLNQGYRKSDIAMGVARALVNNYFAMLVKGIRLKPVFMFQGATAFNGALVKAFTEKIGDVIRIPENPHLMGAYGIAILARENMKGATNFRGWDNVNLENFELSGLNFEGCSNQCEVVRIFNRASGEVRFFGNRCDNCITPPGMIFSPRRE